MAIPFFAGIGLHWTGNSGSVRYAGSTVGISEKPDLGFDYADIAFDAETWTKAVIGDGPAANLSPAEIGAVLRYIEGWCGYPILVSGVSSDGRFVTGARAETLSVISTVAPPDGVNCRWNVGRGEWVPVHCIDGAGAYLGNRPDGQYAALVPSPPPPANDGEVWRFTSGSWTDHRSAQDIIERAKAKAIASVNMAAAAAEAILATPGLALTYNDKLVEARDILTSEATAAAADAMDSGELRASYPLIWASIPTDGLTASDVAYKVQQKALETSDRRAAVEKARRDTVAAITAAGDAAAVTKIMAGVNIAGIARG